MEPRVEKIYDKFRAENWNRLSQEGKQEALQELANLSAERNHAVPCEVALKEMEGACYGYFDGDKIYVNRHIVEEGVMVTHIEDEEGNHQVMKRQVQDANIQMMDTVFHEDYHSFQEQAINGQIPKEALQQMGITEEDIHNWKANNADINYVNPEIDGNLYRIQGLEKTAFDAGEKYTKNAFSYLAGKYGEDANYQKYLENIEKYGYENALASSQMRYGDMDIAHTLQVKMNERMYQEHASYNSQDSAQKVESTLNASYLNAMSPQKELDSGESTSGGME